MTLRAPAAAPRRGVGQCDIENMVGHRIRFMPRMCCQAEAAAASCTELLASLRYAGAVSVPVPVPGSSCSEYVGCM